MAIGDALGAPLEGCPAPLSPLIDLKAGGLFPRKAGEITDDSLQALAVAASLSACRGYSPEDCTVRLIRAYRKAPEWFGPTSSKVFERLIAGEDPEKAVLEVHLASGSRSNGSVTRGLPAGLFFPAAEVGEVSLSLSRLTHYDPVAGACSAFVNRLESEMMLGVPKTVALGRALAGCGRDEVTDLLGSWDRHPVDPGLDALLCTHAAVACFLRSVSFEDALIRAVNLGGDADSVGACCGAMAGVYYGGWGIPGRWLRDLSLAGECLSLGHRLWAASRAG
jgi:ADP-ribosyl-[dinitrogen reductase] hydrolase